MRGRRTQREHIWLDLWSCFLLPGYTLLFAGSVTWFRSNLSVRAAAGAGYYRGFLVWGALAGAYFLVLLGRMTAELPQKRQRRGAYLLLGAAMLCLGAGLPLPYLPERCPWSARLHTMLLFSACVWMMGATLFLLLALRREDRAYGPLVWAWGGIAAGSAALFALSGMISTALEVFFTLSSVQLVRQMWLRKH